MKPLADRLRPQSLDEVVGQTHLVGKNGIIRKIASSGNIPNMVFYGPPGVGKTTVASILAKMTDKKLFKLNGTSAGSGDIKDIIAELDTFMAPDGVLLYLDEIQYFNKKQQQLLLQYMENGKLTLIASTTENPYFYVYPALLSRSTVFEFKSITDEELVPLIKRAFESMECEAPDEVITHVAFSSGGDARKAVSTVELLCLCGDITLDTAKEVTQKSAVKYDKEGDSHYDLLSAFQKSIRGSDENAALHYLARLVAAGDLPAICRRLSVIAAEDIGLAYPSAITVTNACVETALRLGFPEARIPLAEAVILLATAPKSNSAICGIDAALERLNGDCGEIPMHLRDTHYSGAEKMDRGGYKYPHSFENSWVKQQYLPDKIKDDVYYTYGENKIEQATKAYWDKIKK
ncbi:MAG: replication-associated recombination protein A [Clostridia bacterium]|nr:replication-associated recombination protein A [Clostridia bacterium]